mmetsp:Transcript_30128/g.46613  ORF Transcript_30128/g.46613 Transcript_30128/m.46613 type:complete len:83 (-) Transcript_30128:403-651(-)
MARKNHVQFFNDFLQHSSFVFLVYLIVIESIIGIPTQIESESIAIHKHTRLVVSVWMELQFQVRLSTKKISSKRQYLLNVQP